MKGKGQEVVIKHACGHVVKIWQYKITAREIKEEQSKPCEMCHGRGK